MSEKNAQLDNLRLMEEAEDTLRAIREGAVDAFVVQEPDGHRVYTLEGTDLPYSVLVERMQQGAAMLDADGRFVYCNLTLAKILGLSREMLIGLPLTDFLVSSDHASCLELVQKAELAPSEREMSLRRPDGTFVPASFSFQLLSRDRSATGVLITDLTTAKEQTELASRIQSMQDEERKRIARELHDSVGQLLAAISMNIAVVQAQAHKMDATAARAVADNAGLVDAASREIRTISHLLHPPLLDMAGLASALRWYVDGFSERSNIHCTLEIPSDLGRFPDALEIAIFRIVQECLTNIHRHSKSATAAIHLDAGGNCLTVQVQDRGQGIPPEKQRHIVGSGRSGVGFGGMRERLRQLGGTLEIQSDGNGTVVTAVLPLKQGDAPQSTSNPG
jgi:PAS domain S-box-containing protein